jgi:hypothetical protein
MKTLMACLGNTMLSSKYTLFTYYVNICTFGCHSALLIADLKLTCSLSVVIDAMQLVDCS